MKKYLAICIEPPIFQHNRILDLNWTKKYPGTSWLPLLKDMLAKHDIEVVTGDVAYGHVTSAQDWRKSYWQAEDIYVYQEWDSPDGNILVDLGAKPLIMTCFESPVFAYAYYDRLEKFAKIYKHKVLFSGFHQHYKSDLNSHNLYFPSFFSKDVNKSYTPWNQRRYLVMVAANKYWKEKFKIPFFLNPKRYLFWLKDQFERINSPTRKKAVQNSLHDKRLETINYFANNSDFDLFGPGWNTLKRLPWRLRKKYNKTIKELNANPCKDKIKTISNYKFALCFENCSFPGYITEKIIECLLAGVIPVYFGAKDITSFIPKNIFIDFKNFNAFNDLDIFLKNISEIEANKIIEAGKTFLLSAEGQKYSFENFANKIAKYIINNKK
jgi:glycosyl transferase family 10 (putative fucosyltransferase)